MKTMSAIVALAAAAALTAPVANAQKSLQDLLVEKGLITKEEGEQVKQDQGILSKFKGSLSERLVIYGRLHGQFDFLQSEIDDAASDPSDEASFVFRRVNLGVKADLGKGWKAKVFLWLGSGAGHLDAAYLSKKFCDHATVYAGYMKAPFSIEETTSSSKIKGVERSALNRYFIEDLNWGSRVSGVHLKGSHEGLGYTLAITNIRQNNPDGGSDASSAGETSLAYWGRISYDLPIDGVDATVGLDLGLLPDDAGLQYNSALSHRDALAYHFYGKVKYDRFQVLAQLIGANVEDGAAKNGTANSTDASPLGFNLMPTYMVTDKLELVASFSSIDSDGIGIDPGDVTRRANDNGLLWNNYMELYLGGNYYIEGNNIKLSAGLVHGMGEDVLTGGFGSAEAANDQEFTVNGFRVRLQLLF